MTEQTPRINTPLLQQFVGRTIRIVGKVREIRGDTAILDSAGELTAHLDRDSSLRIGSAAELVGKVGPDLKIKVFMSTDFGDNIDMSIYESLVAISQQHKDIFYDS